MSSHQTTRAYKKSLRFLLLGYAYKLNEKYEFVVFEGSGTFEIKTILWNYNCTNENTAKMASSLKSK